MSGHGIKTILIALELSPADRALLDVARTYAAAFQASTYLIHVVPEDPVFVGAPKEGEAAGNGSPDTAEVGYAYDRQRKARRAREEHQELQRQRQSFEQGGLSATALLIEGMPDQKVVAEATRLRADLIVMGSRQRSVVGEWLFGSTGREVVRKARCPVLLVPVKD